MPARPLVLVLAAALAACTVTSHPARRGELGVARPSSALLAVLDAPGPLEVETVASADWVVPLSGLLNLDHPKAKEAQLADGEEPIQIFFHAIRHPTKGTYLVDTGVERAFRDAPDTALLTGFAAKEMKIDRMKIHEVLADWLAKQPAPIAGVLLSHLHTDHIMGLRDVPHGTPIFTGPGETAPRSLMNVVVQGITDAALAGHEAISEWPFEPDADGRFDGVIDVFGDGSLWALWTPGHTPGSTTYLARTTKGPVLFTGDTSHTAFGWQNGVEPGTFTADHAANVKSLEALRQLVAEHPGVEVKLGHQHLDAH